ncbi:MAG: helix-turn-helix transcriptional regulator [Ruminococcaceae bacterium]|nr:helix-turn-helix transcriptional regulator [Oscillospiraceae bacterium]
MHKFQNCSLPIKLKMLRLELGKSQEEFSSELGISRSCLANYETGKRQPDHEMIKKIADLCHVMTDFLMDRPFYRQVPLYEKDPDMIKKYKSAIQNHGNTLDISHLATEHQISLIEFYNYVLNTQLHPRDGRTYSTKK